MSDSTVERYRRESPLAEVTVAPVTEEAPVRMVERPFREILDLRGDAGEAAFREAVEQATGLALPAQACRATRADKRLCLWAGPDEWWIVAPEGDREPVVRLAEALADRHHSLVEIGDSRTTIALSGPGARATLQKSCPLDLHPSVFGQEHVAQSLIAGVGATIHLTDAETPTFEVVVLRSFSAYLWAYLKDCARDI